MPPFSFQQQGNSIEYTTSPYFPGPEYRAVYMQEIFELVYHGNGGFSWDDVWNMNISHRKFCLKKINEFLGKVEEQRNKQNNILTESTDMNKFKLPDQVKKAMEKKPDFVSKAKPKK
jgi:hypothetical protein